MSMHATCFFGADGAYECAAAGGGTPGSQRLHANEGFVSSSVGALACWRNGCGPGVNCRTTDDCVYPLSCTKGVCTAPGSGSAPPGWSSYEGGGGGGSPPTPSVNLDRESCWDVGCSSGYPCRDSGDCKSGMYCTDNVCSSQLPGASGKRSSPQQQASSPSSWGGGVPGGSSSRGNGSKPNAESCWDVGCSSGYSCRDSADCKSGLYCTDDVCSSRRQGGAGKPYRGGGGSGGSPGNDGENHACWDEGCPTGYQCRDSGDCSNGLYCSDNVCSND